MSAKLFGDQQSHQTVLSKAAQAFKLHCQRLYQLFVGGMALISPVPKPVWVLPPFALTAIKSRKGE